jgi:hypothetical protein
MKNALTNYHKFQDGFGISNCNEQKNTLTIIAIKTGIFMRLLGDIK